MLRVVLNKGIVVNHDCKYTSRSIITLILVEGENVVQS